MFSTYHELPSPPPVGYIAQHRYRAGVLWQTSATNSACNEVAPTPPTGLEGFFQEITWWWNDCSTGQYDANGKLITVPMTAHTWNIPLSVIFGSFGSGEQPPPEAPTVDIIPDTTLTTEEIRKRIEDVLNAPGSDYDDFRDWLDSVLGGDAKNPRYEYRAVPSCTGETGQTCSDRLRDAGFTGTIASTTLSQDDAIMELPADRVTATNPATGSEVVTDSDITIHVNPEIMPEMTATETAIAETLKANNPEQVTDQNKKTIARACVKYATASGAGGQASDCVSLPIFVTGNDAATPAENDQDALIRRPSWVLLHHRSTTGVTGPRVWYSCPGTKPALTSQCHEYPYWVTLQANNGAFNSGPGSLTPSIMWTPRIENQRQGGALSHFFSPNLGGSGPSSFPFNGCNIPAQDENALPPLIGSVPGARELAAAPSAFLNVPIGASAPFKTIGICN